MAGWSIDNLACSTSCLIDSYLKYWITMISLIFAIFDPFFEISLLWIHINVYYLIITNLTCKWCIGLYLLTWQGPGKWSYIYVAERLVKGLLLGSCSELMYSVTFDYWQIWTISWTKLIFEDNSVPTNMTTKKELDKPV